MLLKKKLQKNNQTAFQIFLLIGIMVTFITACSTPSIEVTVSPTNVPIQAQQLETSTPLPTWTPRPTNTIAPTPTLDNISVLASEFDISSLCLFNYLISRDQNWIGADCNLSKEFVITGKLNKNKTTIPYQELYDGDLNYFSIRPISWSSDDRYLYFTTRCCNNDDTYNSNGSLYQYDMENKSWDILVHAVNEPIYFFSDDGERYISFNQFPEFTIQIDMAEISTKRNKRVVLKWHEVYDPVFKWSKSGNKFAIVIDKLISRSEHTGEWKDVLLIIDFTRMEMELIEEFNRNNLLGDE